MQKKLDKYLKEKLKGTDLKEVIDIFLFGSSVKGKEFPADIDICVIFRKEVSSKTLKSIENKLNEFNIHMSSLVADNFFRKPHSLIKTLLIEGISILSGRPFNKNFGFSSKALYFYDLSSLNPSDKVRFVYMIKGRKGIGIVKKLEGEWIADSCFTIPIEKDSEMLIILKKWGVPYTRKEILIN